MSPLGREQRVGKGPRFQWGDLVSVGAGQKLIYE